MTPTNIATATENLDLTLKSPRGKEIEGLRVKTRQDASDILSLPKEIDKQYTFLIQDELIVSIFNKKPTLWFDLQQKIKRHQRTPVKERESAEEFEARIVSTFLLPEQHQECMRGLSGEEFAKRIHTGIIRNRRLMQHVEGRTPVSFLEYPTEKLSKLNLSQIKYLLTGIIQRNTGKPDHELEGFNSVLRTIVTEIRSIFDIDIESSLPGLKSVNSFADLDTPAEIIYRWLRSHRGMTSIHAAMFLRALYAWGELPGINSAHDRAKKSQERIFEYLKRLGCVEKNPDEVILSSRENRRAVSFAVPLSGWLYAPVLIESGVKSIRSVLIKLFSDENYNNIDAINDLLGIRIFMHQVLPEHRSECIAWFSRFFGKNAFVFKDKGMISEEEATEISDIWHTETDLRPPLYMGKRWKKKRSSGKYRDCKYAGYLHPEISEKPSGAEVQFFENMEDPNPTGEAHHSILDSAKVIQGWIRSNKFITARQSCAMIRRECVKKDGSTPSWLSISDIFWTLINRGILIPHMIGGADEPQTLIFGGHGHETELTNSFAQIRKYPAQYHDSISKKTIRNLKLDRYIKAVIQGNA